MAETLGSFEQGVLLAVLRLRDQAYGTAIAAELKKRMHRNVHISAVHATLVRLEHRGLLSSRLGEGTEIRAGRPRRFYALEPSGARALSEARKTLTDLWRGIRLPATT